MAALRIKVMNLEVRFAIAFYERERAHLAFSVVNDFEQYPNSFRNVFATIGSWNNDSSAQNAWYFDRESLYLLQSHCAGPFPTELSQYVQLLFGIIRVFSEKEPLSCLARSFLNHIPFEQYAVDPSLFVLHCDSDVVPCCDLSHCKPGSHPVNPTFFDGAVIGKIVLGFQLLTIVELDEYLTTFSGKLRAKATWNDEKALCNPTCGGPNKEGWRVSLHNHASTHAG